MKSMKTTATRDVEITMCDICQLEIEGNAATFILRDGRTVHFHHDHLLTFIEQYLPA